MSTFDWTSLHHAYGNASDIPPLLAAARTAPPPRDYRSEPWYSLWSALYHQDDIYSASYAAVPELVDIASTRRGLVAVECLFLVASIELRRQGPGAPTVPTLISRSYAEAVTAAQPLVVELLAANSDIDGMLSIAHAVFDGDLPRARSLLAEGNGDN